MKPAPSWSEIREYYVKLGNAAAHALLPLVTAIEASRYSQGLFGSPGFFALYITQVPVESTSGVPHLRIAANKDGSLEFRYVDTYVEADQWHRTVSVTDAFSRLERFIEQLHWFMPESVKHDS